MTRVFGNPPDAFGPPPGDAAATDLATQLRQTQVALEQRERHLRAVFDRALDGIGLLDDEFRCLDLNPAACRLLGVTREEMLGRRPSDVITVQEPSDLDAVRAELLAQGDVRGHARIVLRDGTSRDLEYAARANVLPGRHLVFWHNITRRTEAERDRDRLIEELRESEARFRRLAEQAPDIIFRYRSSPTPGLEYVSPSATAITGYTPEEFYADPQLASRMVHPDDRSLIDGSGPPPTAPDSPLHTIRWFRKDGGLLWTELKYTRVFDDRGQVVAVEGIARDVTVRKRVEEHLALFASVIHSSSDAIYGSRMDGIITHWNAASERLYGYTAEEALGKHITFIIPPDRLDEFSAMSPALLAGEAVAAQETVRIRKDGTPIDVLLSVFPLRGPDGQTVGVAAIAQDITERKRAQEDRSWLAAIVDASDDAIIGSNFDGIITSWNAGAERVYGYTAAEMVGQRIQRFRELIEVSDLPQLNDLIRSGQRPGEFTSRRRRKDGSLVDVSISLFPIKDVTGKVIGGGSIARDMTAQRAAEQAFQHLQQRYQSLVENVPAISYISEVAPPYRILYISPQVETMLGFTPDDGASNLEIARLHIHPDDRERVLEEHARSRETQRPYSGEYRLLTRDGHTVWVRDQAVIVRDESGEPQYVQGILVDITDRKQMEAQLEYQALYDTLTALPNRTLLLDRLRQALLGAARHPTFVGFFLLDLDRFKEVNDTFGHFAGDELLRQVAARLRMAVRESDTVARLGGDEFAVVAPAVGDITAAINVAQRITSALEPPFQVEGATLTVRASIGIALSPDHGADGDTLMRHADVAMYAAKRSQLGYALYAPEQDPNSLDRLALLTDLHSAIEGNQLVLHYQPQVDIATGKVAWAEALVRWQHPVRGLIEPDDFVPLAEQTGLIHALTLRVLGGALAQVGAWQRAGLDLGVAVNLSVWDLQDLRLPDRLAELLAASQAPPSRLKLEITESALIADPQQASEVIRRFQSMGVRLSVDDFGTGYSSLAYLKRLPLDELKVDRTFVRDMLDDENDAIIVRSTIEMAHSLGLRTVAEGVENERTWELLRAWGCDVAQGYYVSPPVETALIEHWLRLRG